MSNSQSLQPTFLALRPVPNVLSSRGSCSCCSCYVLTLSVAVSCLLLQVANVFFIVVGNCVGLKHQRQRRTDVSEKGQSIWAIVPTDASEQAKTSATYAHWAIVPTAVSEQAKTPATVPQFAKNHLVMLFLISLCRGCRLSMNKQQYAMS